MGMYSSIEDITNAWSIISSSPKNISDRIFAVPLLHNYICFQLNQMYIFLCVSVYTLTESS